MGQIKTKRVDLKRSKIWFIWAIWACTDQLEESYLNGTKLETENFSIMQRRAKRCLLGLVTELDVLTKMTRTAKNPRLKRKLIRTQSHSMVAELKKAMREKSLIRLAFVV